MTEFLTHYYREHLRFSFGEGEKHGLQYFAHLCVMQGVIDRQRTSDSGRLYLDAD